MPEENVRDRTCASRSSPGCTAIQIGKGKKRKMTTYTISEVSEMFHLPASTLRYYEEAGLLTDVGRTGNGQRVYCEEHINRLRTIGCFKGTGMSIAELQAFFRYEEKEDEHIDDILDLLNERKASVIRQLSQLKKDYNHVLRKLEYYGDIQKSLKEGRPSPDWDLYRNRNFVCCDEEGGVVNLNKNDKNTK